LRSSDEPKVLQAGLSVITSRGWVTNGLDQVGDVGGHLLELVFYLGIPLLNLSQNGLVVNWFLLLFSHVGSPGK
jgi:hypothetical protein